MVGNLDWIGRGGVVALAAIALFSIVGCTPSAAGPGATATPIAFAQQPVDRSTVPTAEVIQEPAGGPPASTGLQIEDSCVVGRMAAPQGQGQIFGGGVNIVVETDSIQTFSRGVADTSAAVCRGNFTQNDFQQLVARINGIPGMRVLESSAPGR